MVGIAELDLLEILRAEGLLLHRRRGVGGDVDLLIGQRKRGLPDDEMFAGRQRGPLDLGAVEEDGISRLRQPLDFQLPAGPEQPDMVVRDLAVPGHGPSARPAGPRRPPPLPAATAAIAVVLPVLGQSGRAWGGSGSGPSLQ